jgi:hypothetical protein
MILESRLWPEIFDIIYELNPKQQFEGYAQNEFNGD